MSELLCNDCLDTGWLEDKAGRSVCSCIAETEPYQQLQAEVERLRKDNQNLRRATNRQIKAEFDARAECERLHDENERLRADAERYRWLRDTGDKFAAPLTQQWQRDTFTNPLKGDEVDAIIDAAMEGE